MKHSLDFSDIEDISNASSEVQSHHPSPVRDVKREPVDIVIPEIPESTSKRTAPQPAPKTQTSYWQVGFDDLDQADNDPAPPSPPKERVVLVPEEEPPQPVEDEPNYIEQYFDDFNIQEEEDKHQQKQSQPSKIQHQSQNKPIAQQTQSQSTTPQPNQPPKTKISSNLEKYRIYNPKMSLIYLRLKGLDASQKQAQRNADLQPPSPPDKDEDDLLDDLQCINNRLLGLSIRQQKARDKERPLLQIQQPAAAITEPHKKKKPPTTSVDQDAPKKKSSLDRLQRQQRLEQLQQQKQLLKLLNQKQIYKISSKKLVATGMILYRTHLRERQRDYIQWLRFSEIALINKGLESIFLFEKQLFDSHFYKQIKKEKATPHRIVNGTVLQSVQILVTNNLVEGAQNPQNPQKDEPLRKQASTKIRHSNRRRGLNEIIQEQEERLRLEKEQSQKQLQEKSADGPDGIRPIEEECGTNFPPDDQSQDDRVKEIERKKEIKRFKDRERRRKQREAKLQLLEQDKIVQAGQHSALVEERELEEEDPALVNFTQNQFERFSEGAANKREEKRSKSIKSQADSKKSMSANLQQQVQQQNAREGQKESSDELIEEVELKGGEYEGEDFQNGNIGEGNAADSKSRQSNEKGQGAEKDAPKLANARSKNEDAEEHDLLDVDKLKLFKISSTNERAKRVEKREKQQTDTIVIDEQQPEAGQKQKERQRQQRDKSKPVQKAPIVLSRLETNELLKKKQINSDKRKMKMYKEISKMAQLRNEQALAQAQFEAAQQKQAESATNQKKKHQENTTSIGGHSRTKPKRPGTPSDQSQDKYAASSKKASEASPIKESKRFSIRCKKRELQRQEKKEKERQEHLEQGEKSDKSVRSSQSLRKPTVKAKSPEVSQLVSTKREYSVNQRQKRKVIDSEEEEMVAGKEMFERRKSTRKIVKT